MKSSDRRLLGRLTLGAIILAVVAGGVFLGWRATHRPDFQAQPAPAGANENSTTQTETAPAPAAARPKLVLEAPDAVILSQRLSDLPKDLLAIPFVKDVVTEDLVNYYEDNADRLGIKGALKRIAFEHDLTWSDQLLESILAKPAEVALWRAANGKLDYFALVIERHPLETVLEGVAKVALSDAQLQQAGEIEVEKQRVPLYALRYMPRKTLFFAAYRDKLLVVSEAALILGHDDKPDAGDAELYAQW
ncbi:MAG TPA: DUF2138 family protein, partial [Pseudomonadales bacterium]|nr:DUF2138 family protein [Pseudomonadales bacterium]